MVFRTSLISILFVWSFSTQAQGLQYFAVGVSPVAYRGDLSDHYQKYNFAFHLGWIKPTEKRVNLQLWLMSGRVQGQHINYMFTNTTDQANPVSFFQTSFLAITPEAAIAVFKRQNYRFYIKAGVGLFRYRPMDEQNQALQNQLTTRAKGEEYGNISACAPLGVGFRYLPDRKAGCIVELAYLNPFTDYVDNLSQFSSSSVRDNIFYIRMALILPVGFYPKLKPTQLYR